MIDFLSRTEVIFTIVILMLTIGIHRFVTWSAAKLSKDLNRSKLRRQYINRYVAYLLWTLSTITIIFVWGISKDGFWTALASTFAVIGVALFANWSILSNLTSSFILYFAFPFKIGDRIRIHDKDLPVTAVIEDIKGFYTVLKTNDGETITYPNNLLMQKGVSILGNKKESVFDINHEGADPTAR
ncbi:mechanosensitive ion channel [Nonlabens mediterrranea]|uniref:Mechanosensitive ion channel n=1 Tax=Nonlabens mediterrranea TaxID=1419947 RepID=A0ABS0A3G7_9FLAO|nr:putative small-conductance mechanosensitive channel [Flavobacteria bacterium BBFL7]MBF4983439.1 mechanosensitive ion channel [Nonlabens mediterrranea]